MNDSSRRMFLKQLGAAGAVALTAAGSDAMAGTGNAGGVGVAECRGAGFGEREQAGGDAGAADGVVARGEVRDVHSLGPVQRDRSAGVGDGGRRCSDSAV